MAIFKNIATILLGGMGKKRKRLGSCREKYKTSYRKECTTDTWSRMTIGLGGVEALARNRVT